MGKLLPVGGRQAHLLEQLAHAPRDVALAADQAVSANRFGHDVVDAPAGIEARIRVLEDHLHAAAYRLLGAPCPQSGNIQTVELGSAASRLVEADHESRDGGFAAAGLADETECAARRDVEAHAVDRPQDGTSLPAQQTAQQRSRHVEGLGQIAHTQQRALRRRTLATCRFSHRRPSHATSRRRASTPPRSRRRASAPGATRGSAPGRGDNGNGKRSPTGSRRAAASSPRSA